jgi:hypothetical protein
MGLGGEGYQYTKKTGILSEENLGSSPDVTIRYQFDQKTSGSNVSKQRISPQQT